MGLFRIVSCGGITIEVMSNTRTTTKMPAKPENEWNTQLVFYKYISLEFGAHSVWLILPKNKYVIIVLYKIGWEASDILVNGLLNVNQVTNRMLKIGHNSIQLYFSWKPWDYYDLNWCGDGVSDKLSMYYYWITLIHRNNSPCTVRLPMQSMSTYPTCSTIIEILLLLLKKRISFARID